MTDPNEKDPSDHEPNATDELKTGLSHLLNAAKKAVRGAEPLANKAAEGVGTALDKINKGGEQVAAEVTREVASLAGKLADRLRAVADRAEPGQRADGAAQHDGTNNDPHGQQ